MFEDSLVESKSPPISATKQWTALSSIAIQITAAAILIALPLLHPEQFPIRVDPPRLLLPLPPQPVIEIKPAQASMKSAPTTVPQVPINIQQTGSHFPRPNPQSDPEGLLTPVSPNNRIWGDTALPAALATANTDLGVSSTPDRPAALPNVSEGVSAGMFLAPIRPTYPAIARATHTEGTVIVEAIISRTGTIERLRVISGPEMLRPAALEAIRAAHYRPYRLNGEPIEVQTTITINFRLNG